MKLSPHLLILNKFENDFLDLLYFLDFFGAFKSFKLNPFEGDLNLKFSKYFSNSLLKLKC
jgi:hypothetical protein